MSNESCSFAIPEVVDGTVVLNIFVDVAPLPERDRTAGFLPDVPLYRLKGRVADFAVECHINDKGVSMVRLLDTRFPDDVRAAVRFLDRCRSVADIPDTAPDADIARFLDIIIPNLAQGRGRAWKVYGASLVGMPLPGRVNEAGKPVRMQLARPVAAMCPEEYAATCRKVRGVSSTVAVAEDDSDME